MPLAPAAFAIPGDLNTRTGGYLYERRLLEELRVTGRDVAYIPLAAGWPAPDAALTAEAAARLGALPADRPLILDGLVFGAIDTDLLAGLAPPVVAMTHHPLGLEDGLPPERAAALIAREAANMRHAAHVVVPSPHTKRTLVARFGVPEDKITIALPGFDRPALPDVPRDDPPLILSVGILCPRKGHDILIEALAQVADLPWHAIIAGRDHDVGTAARLRALCADPVLEGRVVLPGSVEDAALWSLYARAAVFALATRYEGYGIVFGEALLAGLPIVTCAAGAVPETVPPDTGLLVPPDDAPAFAAALRRMLTDPALRDGCGRAARAAGAGLPRWSDTAAVMSGVLDRLAAGQRPKPSNGR